MSPLGAVTMRAAWVLTGDAEAPQHHPGEVSWEHGRLTYVGPPTASPEGRLIDLGQGILAPGLVNGHTHAAMSLMRGLADDSRLMPWLEQHIWPIEAHLTPEDVYVGTLLAAAEMIRGGVVAYADMYGPGDAMLRAARATGLRAGVGWGLIGTADSAASRLEESTALAIAANGADDLVRGWLAPHAPYTCTPELLEHVADQARQHNLPIHIHLAESQEEMTLIADRYGLSPIELADRTGILGPRTLAAHAVYLSDRDIELLASTGTGVIHCPASNLKLGNGVARVTDLEAAGVPVGLGSDGAASTNSLDMFQEMRLAAWLQKSRLGDPGAFSAGKSFNLATKGGARVLGQPDGGVLAVGRPADLVGLASWGSHVEPVWDPLSNLVYAAHPDDVRYTVVAGRFLLDDGIVTVFDEPALLQEARERAADLLRRARGE